MPAAAGGRQQQRWLQGEGARGAACLSTLLLQPRTYLAWQPARPWPAGRAPPSGGSTSSLLHPAGTAGPRGAGSGTQRPRPGHSRPHSLQGTVNVTSNSGSSHPLICTGIPGQCRPPYTPSSGGIHSPALGSQHRCHPRSPLDITSNGGSSCPDTLHGAACCGLHYLSAPFGDAAAGQGRSPSRCWCGWTRLPGPAGSVATGSSGHGSSPPPALKRKHTSEGCWVDPRPPRPRTFRAQTLPGWTG